MLNIDEARQTLIQHKTELSERQQRIALHTRHREEPLSPDFAEQAIELENGETLVALDRELVQDIHQIEHALRRLEDGQYLVCEKCGESIGEARLVALPGTSHCIKCANALDSDSLTGS